MLRDTFWLSSDFGKCQKAASHLRSSISAHAMPCMALDVTNLVVVPLGSVGALSTER